MAKGTKKKNTFKIILALLLLLLIAGSACAWWFIYKPNLKLSKHKQFIYIRTNDTYADVEEILKPLLGSLFSFDKVARYMEYPQQIKAGRYTLRDGMTNKQLVSLLRSGRQEPVKLVIRTYWTMPDVAHVVSKNLETDSVYFMKQVNDSLRLASIGFGKETAMCFILPNTYYFNWNSNADTVINKLSREYRKFWSDERSHKAALLNLTKTEVVILASIVWREIAHADEMPRVAGVYLNRLKKNMRLQADPTVKFALQDFDLRRILNIHLETVSPYNTYLNSGLPPGPICNPPADAIDAVLNAEDHGYIYFCAQPGNTGYHNFAASLKDHMKNAALFHKYLNSLR